MVGCGKTRLALGEQDRGIDTDSLSGTGLEIGADGTCSGDEVGACEAKNANLESVLREGWHYC